MGKIQEYGCIAEHLGHSFSGEIHRLLGLALAKGGDTAPVYRYDLQELAPDEVEPFFRKRAFRGVNVTIPYKQVIMPYLDELTETARAIGAVNTVVNKEGRLIGDNTDFFGMRYLLHRANISVQGKKVLIFGTGGTSNTAHAVASHEGAREILKVSRKAGQGNITYDDLPRHLDAEILINTTPQGMFPHDEASPLPQGLSLGDFKGLCGVLDAVYHPLRTELVSAALALQIPATGGLPMLVAQAAVAAERFLNVSISEDIIEDVTATITAQKENIVLIGMPGSGKTTIGKLLADKTGKELLDTDDVFRETVSMTPGEYIQTYGEKVFREQEAEVIREKIAPLSGVIVATGGGAVLRDENVRRLKRNGRAVFLDRSLASLVATPDRPLSADPDLLRHRYEERYDRYRAVADITLTVADGETPKETADRLLSFLN